MGDAAGDSATFDLNGHSLAVKGLSTIGNSGGSLTSNAAGNLTLTYNGTAAETFNASITNGSAQSIALVSIAEFSLWADPTLIPEPPK